jgi:DNA repair protein RecO (recombination protein O)
MLIKTNAIILRQIKHSDKASIVSVYTQSHGRLSLMVYGSSSKKSPGKFALLQPLSITEITADHQPGKDIGTLKEISSRNPLLNLRIDPVKNALTFFITELLTNILRHPEEDDFLYGFICHAITELNDCTTSVADFHLIFMVKLGSILGIEPNDQQIEAPFFDLLNGHFCQSRPHHEHFLDKTLTETLRQLMHCDRYTGEQITLSRQHRNEMLNKLLEFYKLHLPDFHTIKSAAILQEIFS